MNKDEDIILNEDKYQDKIAELQNKTTDLIMALKGEIDELGELLHLNPVVNFKELNDENFTLGAENVTLDTEAEKIKKFIENNNITKFVARKDKKEYSLDELLYFLKDGNLPQDIIYYKKKINIFI